MKQIHRNIIRYIFANVPESFTGEIAKENSRILINPERLKNRYFKEMLGLGHISQTPCGHYFEITALGYYSLKNN